MVILWAIIRQSRGRSLIFASKTKKNTRNHTISGVYLVAEVGFVGPVKNIVVSGTRHSSCPILLVFSLVALASPSTGCARAPSPLPPTEVVEGGQLTAVNEKRHPTGCLFVSGKLHRFRYQIHLQLFLCLLFLLTLCVDHLGTVPHWVVL